MTEHRPAVVWTDRTHLHDETKTEPETLAPPPGFDGIPAAPQKPRRGKKPAHDPKTGEKA